MKVNRTTFSHFVALFALFCLVYMIYQTSPSFNFKSKHKLRSRSPLQRTVVIADRPINSINFGSPVDENPNQLTYGGDLSLSPKSLQNISDCLCNREWMYAPPPPVGIKFQRLNSSCSDEGTHYQPLQKVISLSMPVPPNTSVYSEAILQNLHKMRRHYPGYSLRLYTSTLLFPNSPFCSLLCQNPDLFWCSIQNTPSHGDLHSLPFQLWRYLPLGDPTVHLFHSRDLISLISHREAATVQHWLSESAATANHKAIMVMRDRRVAHDSPILGKLWSADNTQLGKDKGADLREQIIKMGSQFKEGGGDDQLILEKVIFYPLASKHVVAYDAYNCVKWGRVTEVRPFPTRRQDPSTDIVQNKVNFGGNGERGNFSTKERCPVECRPDYGKDWIYC